MKEAELLYQQAVLLLDEQEPERALTLLEQVVALQPKHARSRAALGYAYDLLDKGPQALAGFRAAHRLNPKDKVAEVYVLTLLAGLGPEKEALEAIRAAAPHHGVDLASLERQLAKARFPRDARTIVNNAFIHARNFFRSWLAREAERIRNRKEPGRAGRLAEAERADCAQFQRALARSFDASRVPESLRPLAGWAARYGVGDDHCRPYLMKRLARRQREKLVREVDGKAAAVQRWLDSFAPAEMTAEAAAFMYLAEGVEEIRTDD